MALTSRHPMIRWAVPALALAAVGAATLAPRAIADPALPPRTAEQLLVDLQNPKAETFSGTVETRSELGLPALPMGEDSEFGSLISGTHTLRVWHAGEAKSRVSVIADGAETSVIRNGDDVWQWSSRDRTAKHAVISAEHAERPAAPGTPPTPQEAAQQILANIEPTTNVTVSQTSRVAGRAAYELVLDPKSDGTLVSKVTIAVDAETNAPLRVEVWPTGATQPAMRVGFTEVAFSTPDDSVFRFSPPAGATVDQLDKGDKPGNFRGDEANRVEPTIVGDGWDQVTVTTMPKQKGSEAPSTTPGQPNDFQQMIEQLPTVEGPWGTGRVLTSSLFTVVITDDGRVAVGMVPTERVVAAIPQ